MNVTYVHGVTIPIHLQNPSANDVTVFQLYVLKGLPEVYPQVTSVALYWLLSLLGLTMEM